MGTNASNKKVASKIVAILLAALMLISVMPMTAFAATTANIVVEGLTIYNDGDFEMVYEEGEEFTFDGLIIEVTYRSLSEIEAEGADKASRAKATINGYDKTEWTRYGIGSNYAEGQVLDLEDNLVPLEFTFGENSSLTLETDVYIAVKPLDWTCAEEVEGFETADSSNGSVNLDAADGQYILVANGDTVILNALTDEDHVDTQLAQYSIAALEGIKVNSKTIADVYAQLEELGLETVDEQQDAVWVIKEETVAFDANNDYVLSFSSVDGKEYIDIANAQDNKQIRDNEWPLSLSNKAKSAKNVVWTLDDEGNLFTTTTVKGKTYYDAEQGKDVTADVEVKLYIAIDEAGYAYLTDIADDAAEIAVYRLGTAAVNDIEIAQNPDKMSYIEGEAFDASGMTVNLMYNDSIVVCVPFELFDVYGIDVYPYGGNGDVDAGETLSIKAHNDRSVVVWFDEYGDETDVKLSVSAAADSEYTLATGDLADGNYAIVWIDEDVDKLAKNTVYEGVALTTDKVGSDKAGLWGYMDGSSYSLYSTGVTDAEVFNNAISDIDSDAVIWTVKYDASAKAYTIQDAETGKYLSRSTLTYKDLWVFEWNAGNVLEEGDDEVASVTTETVIDTVKTLELTNACTADSYWLIDGSYDAAIESKASADTSDNFYLYPGMIAAVAIDASSAEDMGMDNFYFFKTNSLDVISIEIIDQPAAKYASGAALDLHDMVVELTYANGETVEVPYDDFASYGITVNYADGAVLSAADNGKAITVSLGNLSATGIALTVADSKADVAVVRMGGADRYATAAIIAESYVTALGADYANVAVLTSGTNYPDALAGATLASALKAPIVLTKADVLVDATKTFLTDNAVKTVYVIGGEAAVSADVRATLKAMNITIVEVEGADRVETSVAVAKQLAAVKGYSDTIILTNGANFADALSVSSAAAQLGIPVVYVNGGIADSVKAFIAEAKATKAIILGGEQAVSADAEAAVKALGLSVERVAGADRYATGVAIAEYFADTYTGKAITFATGKDFPDALAGGVYAAYVGAPVVLLDNGYANAAAAEYAAGLDLTNVYVFGGTDALSDATINAALLK